MKNLKLKTLKDIVRRYLFIISSIILTASISINSQVNEYHFNRLSLEDGVALNLIFTMIQDKEGFIWFGSMYGLIRYDGENYKTYKYDPENPESISFDDVVSLYEDSKENLWVGTWGGGLNMLNNERNKFLRFVFNPSDENGISDNIIWSVTEDNDGNIFVGTGYGGIDKYDPEEKIFVNYDLITNENGSSPPVWSLLTDRNGIVWAASSNGIYKYDSIQNSFLFFSLPEPDISFTNTANTIIDETENSLLAGTNTGLYRFDKKTNRFTEIKSLSNLRIISIAKDHNDMYWIGTSGGLIRYDRTNEDQTRFTYSENSNSIYGNNVKTVIEDNSGVIWVNSYNSGISKLVNRKSKFSLLQNLPDNGNNLQSNWITSLAEDKAGNIWIGTLGGLHKYNKNLTGVERTGNHQLDKYTGDITTGDKNNILIAGTDQIYTYNIISKKVTKYLNNSSRKILKRKSINNLLQSSDGSLWIGTYNSGVYRYQNGELKQYSLNGLNNKNISQNFILKFFEDSKNRIWVGTYGGLHLYNKGKNNFAAFIHIDENPASISNNYVYSITEDSDGILWVGSARGLNKFDADNESFTSYFEKDGLPNDVICGIVVDGENKLWISTLKGLSHFDPATKSFHNFDKSDGLQSNLFNQGVYLKSSKGDIFFGGQNGLNVFHPEHIQLSKFDSPVAVVSISFFEESGLLKTHLPNKNKLELDYDQNSLVIDVASFDYANPGRIKYKYMLIGFNENWIDNGTNNRIKIQNIPAGNYTLKVMGTNSDGLWSSNEAALSFIINPPFWETTWFYFICIAVILSLILILHRVILKSKIKSAVKTELIKKEEADRIRKKTAVDFHDELGHRLTRISLLTELIKRKLGGGFSEVTSLLNQVRDNSAQLYEGTKDFIWAIDPKNDSMYELLIRLKDFGDELFGNTNIDFEVTGIDEQLQAAPLSMDWKRHLTLIFKEGMNNSLKHSNGNKVILNSKFSGDVIELILVDNGTGFEPTTTTKGNGIKNMAGRALKLGSTLLIESIPKNGTKILFQGKFPVNSLTFN
jgi:ligand-binding sensor domain-containing protein/signal transduction histidine kinase